MGFLAPLYAAGLAAISLPVLFHLIRRTPRGRTVFSSLMFLAPSPPRITRRSRLEHLLLLLLRATALLLIALAFARPFVREATRIGMEQTAERHVAVLLDTSASMRRGDIWNRAVSEVHAVLDGLSSRDRAALFTFDTVMRAVVGFDDQAPGPSGLRERLKSVRPGWHGTDVGACLASLADLLEADADARQSDARLQIVLISDLQEGCRLDALRNFEWPERVHVDVHVIPPKTGDTSIRVLLSQEAEADEMSYRVQVRSDPFATREQFALHWIAADGTDLGTAGEVYVPPGESRIVTLEQPPENAHGIRLDGDESDFDNVVYVAPLPIHEMRVVYVGSDRADDPRGLLFYFQRALVDKGRRRITLQSRSGQQLAPDDLLATQLAVLAEPVDPAREAALRDWVHRGGTVVVAPRTAEMGQAICEQLGIHVPMREADTARYAMLSDMDFQHPMFSALADPRFSDFTKIRFWRYRLVDPPTDAAVVARFDSGDVAIAEIKCDLGRVVVLATTWAQEDSQWAVSTKWVPLVESWLDLAGGRVPPATFVSVGERLVQPWGDEELSSIVIEGPDGTEMALDNGRMPPAPLPGLYRLRHAQETHYVAVNLDPRELRLRPADPSELESFGVRLGGMPDARRQAQRERQLRDQELERRQSLWRWLIAAALVVLLVETVVAGRSSRLVQQGA